MRRTFIALLLIHITVTVQAQHKKNMDKQAIKKMCGCFEVSYRFAETFNYTDDPNYKPSKNKISKGLEWAQLVVDKKIQKEMKKNLKSFAFPDATKNIIKEKKDIL